MAFCPTGQEGLSKKLSNKERWVILPWLTNKKGYYLIHKLNNKDAMVTYNKSSYGGSSPQDNSNCFTSLAIHIYSLIIWTFVPAVISGILTGSIFEHRHRESARSGVNSTEQIQKRKETKQAAILTGVRFALQLLLSVYDGIASMRGPRWARNKIGALNFLCRQSWHQFWECQKWGASCWLEVCIRDV